jgi:hypothetical protein
MDSPLGSDGLTTTSLPANCPAAISFNPTHAAGNWNCKFFGMTMLTPLTEILPPVLYSEESAVTASRAPSKVKGITAALSKPGKSATKGKSCLIIVKEMLECLMVREDVWCWMVEDNSLMEWQLVDI